MLVLEIPITQEDIDRGQQRSYSLCPLALAVTRLTGQETEVHCSRFLIFTPQKEGQGCEFKLDRAAKDFVHAFDSGDAVHPITVIATMSPENALA